MADEIISYTLRGQVTNAQNNQPLENITIGLWQKSPLQIYQLGIGNSDSDGKFSITYHDPLFLSTPDESIENAYLKIFFQNVEISRYPENQDEFIRLNKGENVIDQINLDIQNVEVPVILGDPLTSTAEHLFIGKLQKDSMTPLGGFKMDIAYVPPDGTEPYLITILNSNKQGYFNFNFTEPKDFQPDVISGENYASFRFDVYYRDTIAYSEDRQLLLDSPDVFRINATIDITIPDTSPTIDFLNSSLSLGIPDSLINFLSSLNITTLNGIRKAGNLKYLSGLPLPPDDPSVKILQSHSDLYTISDNITLNHVFVAKGFDSVYKIGSSSRSNFVSDTNAGGGFFNTALIHRIAEQQVRYLNNVLTAAKIDLKTESGSDIVGNDSPLNQIISCGCSECKSGVSPLAYLADLLQYACGSLIAQAHIQLDNHPITITDLENMFFQPFGQLPASCNEIHNEVCQVRLCIEVLRKYLQENPPGTPQANLLAKAEKQYRITTYYTLLNKLGTSFDEIRATRTVSTEEKKKLADRLGIVTTFDPIADTIDELYLDPSAASGAKQITEAALERIFGFRDTTRDVLTITPGSEIAQWKKAFLLLLWQQEDWLNNDFTQGGPIVDPDLIGPDDIREPAAGNDAFDMWKIRRDWVDMIINNFSSMTRVVGVDQGLRKFVIADTDLTPQIVMPPNTIYDISITNSTQNDGTYSVFSVKLVGTNTEFTVNENIPSPMGDGDLTYLRSIEVLSYTTGTSGLVVLKGKNANFLQSLINAGAPKWPIYDHAQNESLVIMSTVTDVPVGLDFETHVTVNTLPVPTIAPYERMAFGTTVQIFNEPVPDVEQMLTRMNVNFGYAGPINSATMKPWDSAFSIADLTAIYNDLNNGADVSQSLNSLSLTVDSFRRLVELIKKDQLAIVSPAQNPRLGSNEWQEFYSILTQVVKNTFSKTWHLEEFDSTIGVEDFRPQYELVPANFWISVTEPQQGIWSPVIDDRATASISDGPLPYIDPELVSLKDLPDDVYGNAIVTLWVNRKAELDTINNDLRALGSTQSTERFNDILKYALGDPQGGNLTYPIDDYYTELISSIDPFELKGLINNINAYFFLSEADFRTLMEVKIIFDNPDPALKPSATEWENVYKILTTACKVKRKYTGWFNAEDAAGYQYWKVYKAKLPPWRSDYARRLEWQETIVRRMSVPVIDPDQIALTDILHPQHTNADKVCLRWIERRYSISSNYSSIKNVIAGDQNNFNSEVQNLTGVDFSYLENLAATRDQGADITIRLQQLWMTNETFDYLLKIHDITSPVTTEWEDVYAILTQVVKLKLYAGWQKTEQKDSITLDPDRFKIQEEQPTLFPIADLPVLPAWRATYKGRKAWLNILKSRIEQIDNISASLATIIGDTEDITLKILRDALVNAVTDECMSLDSKGKWFTKNYLIDAQNNCCSRTTRISQAMETLQGILWSLRTGIFTDEHTNLSLNADHFDDEWEWIGSYATWRAAMFVFMYPENLLHPNLRKTKSAKYNEIAEKMRSSARFTPDDACNLANEYSDYYYDICNLTIGATCSAMTPIDSGEPGCGQPVASEKELTYIFAKVNGKDRVYWTIFDATAPSDNNLLNWEPMNGVENIAGIIGASVYFPSPKEKYIYFFFTTLISYVSVMYPDTHKFVRYNLIEKVWDDEPTTLVFPAVPFNPNLYFVNFVNIVMCQNVRPDTAPFFAVNCLDAGHMPGYYFVQMNAEGVQLKTTLGAPTLPNTPYSGLIKNFCVISYQTNSGMLWDLVVGCGIPYENISVTIFFFVGVTFSTNFTIYNSNANYPANSIGLINARVYDDSGVKKYCCTFVYSDYSSINRFITFEWTPQIVQFNPGLWMYPVDFIAPSGSQLPSISGQLPTPNDLRLTNYYLTFNAVTNISYLSVFQFTGINLNSINNIVQTTLNVSGEYNIPCCLTAIEKTNRSAAEAIFYQLNSSPINELLTLLDEAYYHLPMLFAFELCKRGYYQEALSWYSTVYDWNLNQSDRKIWYGLIFEETISNVYLRQNDWLLDPLNPHLIARGRRNAYCRFTLLSIVQCLNKYADSQFTFDTAETVPVARDLYLQTLDLLGAPEVKPAPNTCISKINCMDISDDVLDSEWAAVMREIQQQMTGIHDPRLLTETVDSVTSILNSSDPPEDKIEDIQNLVADAVRNSNQTISIAETIEENAAIVSDMQVYVQSNNSIIAASDIIKTTSSDEYSKTISFITDIPVSELADGRFEWLGEKMDYVSKPFNFENDKGQQNFSGGRAYNPVSPSQISILSNLYFDDPNKAVQKMAETSFQYVPILFFSFCVPDNIVYSALQFHAELNLYKIHNCRNIAGIKRELDPYAAPTDTTTGLPMIGADGSLILPGLAQIRPTQYRYKVLIERAKQIVALAQQVEAAFLASLEKRDAEYYNILKAKQDLESATASVQLQDLRIQQAQDEVSLAQLQQEKAQFSSDHFQELLAAGLSGLEETLKSLLEDAAALFETSAATSFIPTVSVIAAGQNSGTSVTFPNPSAMIAAAAQASSAQAALYNQLASFERRAEEWDFQKSLSDFDINIAGQQIKISEDNVRITGQERQIAVLNRDHSKAVIDFLNNKFTNVELYEWMSGVLESIYSFFLGQSTAIAKMAENQLAFERQEVFSPYIKGNYWEVPNNNFNTQEDSPDRRGLTGSARLLQDIYQLDQYAFTTDKRKLQLSKTISLAQLFPVEFQQFRETGVITFQTLMDYFDRDFPGHYLRLIKAVKTSVIALIPPTQGIRAALASTGISYTVIGGDIFQRIPIRRDPEVVALTGAFNATGVFDLQAQSEFLNPFEGSGVESTWEFKMPKAANFFDYKTVADVLITIDYTALQSYDYERLIVRDIDSEISSDAAFSFKNNFADQWYDFNNPDLSSTPMSVKFKTSGSNFPPNINEIKIRQIVLYFSRADGETFEIKVNNFKLRIEGTTQEIGGAAQSVNGLLSTRSGSAPAWNVMTGKVPFGEWTLELEDTQKVRGYFKDEKIQDIIFVITYRGELPQWPV